MNLLFSKQNLFSAKTAKAYMNIVIVKHVSPLQRSADVQGPAPLNFLNIYEAIYINSDNSGKAPCWTVCPVCDPKMF